MREQRGIPYVAVAVLAAALYAHTTSFGFVFDDRWLVVENEFLREPWSAPRAFAHHFWHGTPFGNGYYRPLVTASFALNGRLLGWGPAGFHVFNVLLHAINTALVLLLATRLGFSSFAAGVAAVLFAVHPAAAWSVASIAARVDLLPAFFILLAWIAWAGPGPGLRSGSASGPAAGVPPARSAWTSPLATGLFFLGALLCKESAVAFLGVLLVTALRPPHRAPGAGEERDVAAKAPPFPGPQSLVARRSCWRFAVATGTALAITLVARWQNRIGLPLVDVQINPLAEMPWSSRTIAALELSGRYLLYLVFPYRFSDPHDFSRTAPPPEVTVGVAASAVVLVACAAAIVFLWWRRDRLALPAEFALATFLPASNLLMPISSLYAENFLYMPLLGLCLVVGDLLHRYLAGEAKSAATPTTPSGATGAPSGDPPAGRSKRLPVRFWIAGTVVLVLGLKSAREVMIWRDMESLFRAWTQRFPHYGLAHGHLGLALLDGGNPQAALAHLRRALEIDDRDAKTRSNLAVALMRTARGRADLEEALGHSRAAIDLDATFVNARINAAQILLRLERPAEAEKESRAALAIAPDLYPARLNLAESLFRQESYREAAEEFGRLVAVTPEDARVRSAHVASLLQAADLEAARPVTIRARRDFPNFAWFDFCLARIQARSGNGTDALALLKTALAKDPATREWIGQVGDFDAYKKDPAFAALLGPAPAPTTPATPDG